MNKKSFGVLFFISFFALALTACPIEEDTPQGGTKDCTINSKTYSNGADQIPAEDGCNYCSCQNGRLACTLMGCVDTCELDGQVYASGTTDILAPDGCNTCSCENGVLACTEMACSSSMVIERCGEGSEIPSDAFSIDSAQVVNDEIEITLSYSGGCEQHDFSLCYNQYFAESYPVQNFLKLTHDAHNDSCEAWITETVRFDLTPLKDYYYTVYGSNALGQIQLSGLDIGSLLYEF